MLKKIYSLLGIYKKKVFFIFFVFILNTGVEILGVGLVIPYINILFRGNHPCERDPRSPVVVSIERCRD